MTGKQRVMQAMRFQQPDRLPRYWQDFWPEFQENWKRQFGAADLHRHFGDDMRLVAPEESAFVFAAHHCQLLLRPIEPVGAGVLQDQLFQQIFDLRGFFPLAKLGSGKVADELHVIGRKLHLHAAGNLTYDGSHRYSYDAWNRLLKVWKDNHDASDDPLIATMAYDGLGRRISKAIANSGDFDCTYHFYYDGQRCVEIRNGSSQVLKQHVWGLSYIDELVQVGLNQDPQNATSGGSTENVCELYYWAMQDANYNVLGLVNKWGMPIERYEYTAYGQRQVYSHGRVLGDTDQDGDVDLNDLGNFTTDYGQSRPASVCDFDGDGDIDTADQSILDTVYGTTRLHAVDPLVSYPRNTSYRLGYHLGVSGEPMCSIGHQGLMHDEELGNDALDNRARYLKDGRYNQRDPLGYVDGMGFYEYEHSSPVIWGDPNTTTLRGPDFGLIG